MTKIRMTVSLAGTVGGRPWDGQPGQVVAVEDKLARQWVRSGLAAEVPQDVPLTSETDALRDLSIEEARTRACEHCELRAEFVLGNLPYCRRHYLAEQES